MASYGRGPSRGRGTIPAALIGAALVTTLIIDAALVLSGDIEQGAEPSAQEVQLPVTGSPDVTAGGAAPPAVAPLSRRFTPNLLVAAPATLNERAITRARRLKGVAGVEVVDAANAMVGGRRLGLLGVDPSSFRAYTPRPSAESDPLWLNVADGGLAVSSGNGQDGDLPLGATVPAGRSTSPGQVRVGAYAAMGMGRVDAVVSRNQARALGMPQGNALVVSAPKADPKKLAKSLKKLLPRSAKVAFLTEATTRRAPAAAPAAPRVSGRPDGVSGGSTPVTGNSMTPRMRTVVVEINNRFGPFPTIGCHRTDADAQDHATGNACDFMESTAGRMPTAGARAHGDQVANYVIANAPRLGIKYLIWRQHIWNVTRGGGWRAMEDRGSITQNHYDHVHISVL